MCIRDRLTEDPARFLDTCKRIFVEYRVPTEEWSSLAQDQLRGKAATYYTPYQNSYPPWNLFRDRLLRRYNGEAITAKVSTSFYSEPQGTSEEVEVFIAKKSLLYSRLHPHAPEHPSTIIPLLINQLHAELRPHLLTARPKTLDELLDLSTSLENTLSPHNSSSKPTGNRESRPRQPGETTTLPPCQHCLEWHYHRDCPVLKKKLGQRSGDEVRRPTMPSRFSTTAPAAPAALTRAALRSNTPKLRMPSSI